MPAKSGKQYRFMQAMAHGKKKKKGKGVGPSPGVAKEIIAKTPTKKRSKWAETKGVRHLPRHNGSKTRGERTRLQIDSIEAQKRYDTTKGYKRGYFDLTHQRPRRHKDIELKSHHNPGY